MIFTFHALPGILYASIEDDSEDSHVILKSAVEKVMMACGGEDAQRSVEESLESPMAPPTSDTNHPKPQILWSMSFSQRARKLDGAGVAESAGPISIDEPAEGQDGASTGSLGVGIFGFEPLPVDLSLEKGLVLETERLWQKLTAGMSDEERGEFMRFALREGQE